MTPQEKLKEIESRTTALSEQDADDISWLIDRIKELEAQNKKLREALEFYANGAHWTTHDDEMLFNNISDKDWDRTEDGKHFRGGLAARQALTEGDMK